MNADLIDRYVEFWQALSADRLDSLSDFMTQDIHFSDPFNDLRGLAAVRETFSSLYAKIHDVDVTVHDKAISTASSAPTVCYLRWTFAFSLKSGRRMSIEGVSEVHLEPDGRASVHIDHWDAAGQMYEKFPLIGPVLRAIRKRI
ncbi:MAG: nuclear transport factor 2 family protein [Pseudomonadota bacterium]